MRKRRRDFGLWLCDMAYMNFRTELHAEGCVPCDQLRRWCRVVQTDTAWDRLHAEAQAGERAETQSSTRRFVR